MLSVAAFRYRNVLAEHGGPIRSIEVGEWAGSGPRRFQANARLCEHLVPRRRRLTIYGNADGTGTHASPMVARFMAVSEALERWAYHVCVGSEERERYGFDLDASSNGMAAYPGITAREARQRALFEAIERASLFDWWEGRCKADLVPTEWPGTHAVQISNPLGMGVTVVAFREVAPGCFAYGHAAAARFPEASVRAAIEMQRCSLVLCHHRLAYAAGRAALPTDRFERRCLFFSTSEGHELFRQRLADTGRAGSNAWRVVCDREIPGPWSKYATVWRVVIPSPTSEFLTGDERYFFW